ncbi:MAG TPA: hypothetical protein VG347_07610 [Verrucomicrobiae bacterium]|nr:hypothetical protein [Verrucomicrobiae bacterium]
MVKRLACVGTLATLFCAACQVVFVVFHVLHDRLPSSVCVLWIADQNMSSSHLCVKSRLFVGAVSQSLHFESFVFVSGLKAFAVAGLLS